jgi:hypothetical protein
MAAEITQIDPQSFLLQTYEGQDTNLISTLDINTSPVSKSILLSLIVFPPLNKLLG